MKRLLVLAIVVSGCGSQGGGSNSVAAAPLRSAAGPEVAKATGGTTWLVDSYGRESQLTLVNTNDVPVGVFHFNGSVATHASYAYYTSDAHVFSADLTATPGTNSSMTVTALLTRDGRTTRAVYTTDDGMPTAILTTAEASFIRDPAWQIFGKIIVDASAVLSKAVQQLSNNELAQGIHHSATCSALLFGACIGCVIASDSLSFGLGNFLCAGVCVGSVYCLDALLNSCDEPLSLQSCPAPYQCSSDGHHCTR